MTKQSHAYKRKNRGGHEMSAPVSRTSQRLDKKSDTCIMEVITVVLPII
jgi:hypothetical protein